MKERNWKIEKNLKKDRKKEKKREREKSKKLNESPTPLTVVYYLIHTALAFVPARVSLGKCLRNSLYFMLTDQPTDHLMN